MRLRGKPDATSDIDRDKLAIQELVRLNRLSELEAKLASNPQLASKEVDGITPLHIACEVGSAAAIELLLEKRVSMNVKNPTKQTPLDICYHHNHQKTAILLLERGAQFTPGDVKTSVYSRYHRDVLDTTKNCGRTLLHWAARQGNTNALAILLNRGVPICATNESGSTAMHIACAFKHLHVVEWLIARGGSLAQQDHKGSTPIDKCKGTLGEELRLKHFAVHCAVQQAICDGNTLPVSQVLDAMYADNTSPNPITVLDNTNHTPLMIAALANEPTLVNLILNHPIISIEVSLASVLETSTLNSGDTALSLCVKKNLIEMVTLLCQKGAAHEIVNSHRPAHRFTSSILQLACRQNAYAAAEQLCLYGSKILKEESWVNRLTDRRGANIPEEEKEKLLRAYELFGNWERRKALLMVLLTSGLLKKKNISASSTDVENRTCVAAASFCSASSSRGSSSSSSSLPLLISTAQTQVLADMTCMKRIISFL